MKYKHLSYSDRQEMEKLYLQGWHMNDIAAKLGVGYDAGETRSIQHAAAIDEADKKYEKHYPLYEWGWDRAECVRVIERAGLPKPGKSSCYFCPSMEKKEIQALWENNPDLFQRAVDMEHNAADSLTSIKGLGRKWSWDWLAAPWYATTYEKDKQFFNPVGTVEHKTPVTVIEQELTGGEYGKDFSGYLLVERVDNGEQFYISVTDFVTEPYWETTSATEVGYTNPCLAVYHQCSDYYPVDRNGKKYNAADGEVVMIFGATNWGGIDRETNQVDVLGANAGAVCGNAETAPGADTIPMG